MRVEISQEQNGQSVTAHVGDLIVLRLPENASTGYRWSLEEIDGQHLAMYEQGYEPEEAAIGSGGLARLSLRAIAEGVVRIEARKWRPWAGESSVIDRFALSVAIQPPADNA